MCLSGYTNSNTKLGVKSYEQLLSRRMLRTLRPIFLTIQQVKPDLLTIYGLKIS